MTRDHVTVNRDLWNADAPNWVGMGERLWSLEAPEWGNWGEPESAFRRALLPPHMAGMTAIELGCGTGYVAGWMARRGARVTAIDISVDQLATARRLAAEHGAEITWIEGNAEATGLPDQTFDFAISEYGAAIWCRPEVWLTEAFRLLRPGGQLVFLGNHPLSLICAPLDGSPCDRTLHRPYRGMWGADWTGVTYEPSGICFNHTFGDWVALFARIGFGIVDYQEVYAPDWADDRRGEVPADWAKAYPVEQVWHLAKPG
ncbi:class I SAM-dependent methyltransferase [Pseudooceanicola onchidii]|uniref:class I SAM-dependent methyltransferase n=1 Tax=Pseudooceanicola onchidii TaxID=2562279 RepID=UPI0010AB3ED1|nr:class I SAM-dependent methyltransferase [Pseudooceanicola onchidii]